jgi:hypothetical protein
MNQYPQSTDRAEGPAPGGDIEANARQGLEAAEGATDKERLEVLERLYKDLEDTLES